MANNHSALIESLDLNTLVITGNNRLARALHDEYSRQQIDAKKQVWDTPNILSFSQWTGKLWLDSFGGQIYQWQDDRAGRRLLSSEQETMLWQRVLDQSPHTEMLLHKSRIVSSAQQAYQMLKAANLDVSDWPPYVDNDAKAYRDWQQEFVELCAESNWLPLADLVSALTGIIETTAIPLPKRIVTIGFEEFTPQQQMLWQAVSAHDCQLDNITDTETNTNKTATTAAETPLDEFYLAAEWAKNQQNSGKQVAIVVLELEQQRAAVETAFRKTLSADQAFNITLGLPLNNWPMVRHALDWLDFAVSGADANTVGQLLRNPWHSGGLDEAQAAAVLDVFVRNENRLQWRIGHLLGVIENKRFAELYSLDKLPKLLVTARDIVVNSKAKQAASAWCEWTSKFFHSIGWPSGGDGPQYPLDENDHQLLGAWEDCLNTLAGLDEFIANISLKEFCLLLQKQAANTIYQPRTGAANIQIMGLLEASGAKFDALWVCGMSDVAWPQAPSPNPLLPLAWQRQNAIPRASVERELDYAKRITTQLANAADQVVFSWPQSNGDEEYRCSPLLNDYLAVDNSQLVEKPASTKQYGEALVTTVEDEKSWIQLPGYQANETIAVKGGTAILTDQSACGFRAFAKHRLYAQPLAETEFGIDSRDRGSLVHKSLELLWLNLKNQQALLKLPEPELQILVENTVQQAQLELQGEPEEPADQRLSAVELAVLTRLLLEWLEQDKARSDFIAVQTEQNQTIKLGSLEIQTKVDRIDVLADNSLALIDYKTASQLSEKDWLDERPDAPQLPIYAVALTEQAKQVAAVIYAKIKLGESKYIGISDTDSDFEPKLKSVEKITENESLTELYAEWANTLTGLANDFTKGVAVVDPKNDKTCAYCGLQSLCRFAIAPEGAE